MAYKYSVFSAYPFEEVADINYSSIALADLIVSNAAGRRLAKHNYGRNFATFQDWFRNTKVQSQITALNQTTFTTWLWFESDVPLGDAVLLARGSWHAPIWSIRTICGHIAFEIGDGLGGSWALIGPEVVQGEHFVAVSYDDNTKQAVLYYDAAVVATGTNLSSMPTTKTGIAYGSYVDGGLPWNGWIDSALWTALVLDTAALDDIYNAGSGRDIPWFFPEEMFSYLCIIKHDKLLVLERSAAPLYEHTKQLVLDAR